MNFIFLAIKEHPWGREMLSQLLDAGFTPSLIIEEFSEGGEIEREKFEFRIGTHTVGPTMKSQAKEHKIPVVEVPIHNDKHCMEYIEEAEPDLIVFGGTIGATLLETKYKRLKNALYYLSWVFFPPPHDPEQNISKILTIHTSVHRYIYIEKENNIYIYIYILRNNKKQKTIIERANIYI